MSETGTITEMDILADVIQPDSPDLSLDAAREILKWRFRDAAVARMNELAERNNQGLLTTAERDELHKYLRVGNLINLLQAKARLALALRESLDHDSGSAPRDVISDAKRRDAELESGKVAPCSHDEVMQAARRAVECTSRGLR